MQTCPKCGAKFEAGEARGGYATMTVFRGGALDTKLRCPECSHVFQPNAAGHLAKKVFLGLIVVLAVAVVAYLLALQGVAR
jgi:uncharacterized C2H2 Zn-finger protein